MNIFFLDEDPRVSASYMFKEHLVKMPLESAQILCTNVRLLTESQEVIEEIDELGYCKSTHKNHPSTIWARQSRENFQWLVTHSLSIIFYHKLYSGNKQANIKMQDILFCSEKINTLQFPREGLTNPLLAMPEEIKFKYCSEVNGLWESPNWDSAIEAYREYYNTKVFKARDGSGLYNRLPTFYKDQQVPFWYIRDDV